MYWKLCRSTILTSGMFLSAGLALAAHAGAPPLYEFEVIANNGEPQDHARAINDSNVVVGYHPVYLSHQIKPYAWVNETFVELDSPALYAQAVAINNSDVVVGFTTDDEDPERAVRWTDLDAPGEYLAGLGAASNAWDVNDVGVIVGWTDENADGSAITAFRWENGTVELLGTLGGAASRARGINDDGQITGSADTAGGQTHVFLYDNGIMTDLGDFSEAGGNGGIGYDISGNEVIVGAMFTDQGRRAFRWENGVAQSLGVLYGNHNVSEARAVNDDGMIIGVSWEEPYFSSTAAAFLWQDGEMFDLRQQINSGDTNLLMQSAFGLNASGDIAGTSTYGNQPRAVHLEVSDAEFDYEITSLGTIPAGAYTIIPRGLNNNNEVVGWLYSSELGPPYYYPWKWTAETGMVVLSLPPNGEGAAGQDINDVGQIAIESVTSYGDEAWRLEPDGTFTQIGLLEDTTWANITGINAAGDMVGVSDDHSPQGFSARFFLYTTGLIEIPDEPEILTSIGHINDLQQTTGFTAEGNAYRWSPADGGEILPHPDGFSYGYGINNSGQVSGIVSIDNDKFGALYTDGQGWQLIADFLGQGNSEAPAWEYGLAVNEAGVVVGYSEYDNPSEGYEFGWVWTEETGARRLDEVFSPAGFPPSFHLFRGVDVNDAGVILATGTSIDGGLSGAFLLTPADSAQAASLIEFDMVNGSLIGGELGDLVNSDDQVVQTRSERGFLASEPNLMEMIIGATSPVDATEVGSFDLTIESNINHPSGTATIALRDWSNDQFEQVGMHDLGFDETVETFLDIDATDHVRDSDARIELSVKHIVLAVFVASGFDSFVDHVEVVVE